MSDLDFGLSMSHKVKSNGTVGLHIYDFLLVSNSDHMSNCYRLVFIAMQIFFSYLLLLGLNFEAPTLNLIILGRLFPKLNGFLSGSQERLPPNIKLIGSIFF